MNSADYLEILDNGVPNHSKELEETYFNLIQFANVENSMNVGRDMALDLANASCRLHNILKDLEDEGIKAISETSEVKEYFEMMSEIFEKDSKEFRRRVIIGTILPKVDEYVLELFSKEK